MSVSEKLLEKLTEGVRVSYWYKCPYCGRGFQKFYSVKIRPGTWAGSLPMLAKANFDRHVDNCPKRPKESNDNTN